MPTPATAMPVRPSARPVRERAMIERSSARVVRSRARAVRSMARKRRRATGERSSQAARSACAPGTAGNQRKRGQRRSADTASTPVLPSSGSGSGTHAGSPRCDMRLAGRCQRMPSTIKKSPAPHSSASNGSAGPRPKMRNSTSTTVRKAIPVRNMESPVRPRASVVRKPARNERRAAR